MNLLGLTSGIVGLVNPNITVIVRSSTGSAPDAEGNSQPAYAAPVAASAQVQSLTTKDLMHLEQLNVQGSSRTLYCNVPLYGVDRKAGRGGDLVNIGGAIVGGTVTGGATWLVTAVLEAWVESGWCKVAIMEQLDQT